MGTQDIGSAHHQQDRAIGVLDDLLQCDGGLSGWEMDFIEDMDRKRKQEWTPRQIEKLDQIYERVC